MTSTSIYTPITPTYLYIKQHSITKKKYYGKTSNLDPYTYNGSGVYWTNHIKVHGKEHIVTLWVSDLYYDTSIVEVALKFSADNDIVKSKEWANMEPENGLNGWVPGRKRSEESKVKMRKSKSQNRKRKPCSEETKAKMRKPKSEETKPRTRKPCSEETKAKRQGKKRDPYKKSGKPQKPRSNKGKPKSEEHKANMRKPKSEEHKAKISAGNKGNPQPQITCPHCGKTGGNSNMKRWHFDNCKLASKA
jgi:hypothetical protein